MLSPSPRSTLSVAEHCGLSCRTAGAPIESSAATLLWIHGLGESGLGFESLILHPALQAFHHLVPDLQGYGRSSWPKADAPLTLEQHALSVRALASLILEQHPKTRIVVIGHSMGGVIGQILCETFADRLAAFVNLEGNLSYGDCGYSGKAEPQSLEEFVACGYDQLCDEILALAASDSAHRTYFASCSLCQPEAYHLNSVELVNLSKQEQLALRFAELTLPKVFVQGKPTGAPQRSTELLQEHGVDPVLFDPAGHWPFVDQQADFVDWLRAWLRTQLEV